MSPALAVPRWAHWSRHPHRWLGDSAAAGSVWSSAPRRGPGSCDAARRSHGA